jgi:quercetin dioxygenase-like cupin family protein
MNPLRRLARPTLIALGAGLLWVHGADAAESAASPSVRLTPSEIAWPVTQGTRQEGSSMQTAVQSIIVYGDASKPALYTILFKVAPNAAIPAHSHPENRSCFVVGGVWYFGYGDAYAETALKELPPGSHYTEPANVNHFAGTKGQGATVECTAIEPSGTKFVDQKNDPRR